LKTLSIKLFGFKRLGLIGFLIERDLNKGRIEGNDLN